MSNEMSREQLVDELDRIDGLYKKYVGLMDSCDSIGDEVESENNGAAQRAIQNVKAFRKERAAKMTAERPRFSDSLMKESPVRELKKLKSENPEKDILIGSILGLAVEASLAFMVVAAIFFMEVAMFMVVPVMGLAWAWAIKTNLIETVQEIRKTNEDFGQKKANWEKTFDGDVVCRELERVVSEFRAYDSQFLGLVSACHEKLDEEQKLYDEEREKIRKEALERLDRVEQDMKRTMDELKQTTLLQPSQYGEAWRISSLLKEGRADTLKEAINLAMDEARKDREEAERREEAQRQEEILEQQAADNRRHNAAMQRAAEDEARAMREHNQAMERAAQQQARAAEEQARAAEAQAQEAKRQSDTAERQARAASNRCRHCANLGKCSATAMMSAQNCAAYRPR